MFALNTNVLHSLKISDIWTRLNEKQTVQKTQQNRTEKLWWGEGEWRTAGQREGAQRSSFPKAEKFSQNRKCGPGVSKMRMRTNKCDMRREEGSVW